MSIDLPEALAAGATAPAGSLTGSKHSRAQYKLYQEQNLATGRQQIQ
jgi:hypothetical protein